MKKYLALLLAVIIGSATLFAESFDDKMRQYANSNGITTVYITKAMLSMAAGMNIDAGGMDLKAASDKIDNISIATSDTKIAATHLRSDADKFFIESKKYETLMKVQDSGEQTTILSRNAGKGKMEYVVLASEPGEFSIIVIRGSMTPQDISKMLRK